MMLRSVLLLPLLLPASLQAQARSRCTDSLADAHWRQSPLTAGVIAPPSGDRDQERYAVRVLGALPTGFIDPGADRMPTTAVGVVPSLAEREPIHATLVLDLDRNGRHLAARLSRSSGNRELDAAILQSGLIIGGITGLGKVPRKLRGDTIRFTIQIDDRDPPPHTIPYGTLSSAYLVADVAPRLKSMPTAHAPRGRRGREVTFAATVNSSGRIVPASIRLVSTNDPSLVPIARASFERAVYTPGTRHGCPAESYIRQRFPFP